MSLQAELAQTRRQLAEHRAAQADGTDMADFISADLTTIEDLNLSIDHDNKPLGEFIWGGLFEKGPVG